MSLFYNRPAGGRRLKPYAGGAGRTQRTPVGDADYTIKAWDKVVALQTITVARTWTLPPVSSVPPGNQIILLDESGLVSSTDTISLATSGSDLSFFGGVFTRPYFWIPVISDGVDTWYIDGHFEGSFEDELSYFAGNVSVVGALDAASVVADNITAAGALRTTSASDPLGYNTGSGGDVTQAANKATAVTVNAPNGRVTTGAGNLNAGVSVTFTVNNSTINATDHVFVGIRGAAFAKYRVEAGNMGTGTFDIRLTNITAGALAEAIQINFAIINGVIS